MPEPIGEAALAEAEAAKAAAISAAGEAEIAWELAYKAELIANDPLNAIVLEDEAIHQAYGEAVEAQRVLKAEQLSIQ